MSRFRRALSWLISIVILGAGLSAQEGEAVAGIDWQPEVAAALQLAQKENRPILVAFVLRGEPANEQICGEHFQNDELIALSREFVCLLALATYASPDVTAATTNSDKIVHSLEGRVTAKQLAKIEMDARCEWMDSGLVSAPQFLFLKPDGSSFLLRHVWMLDRSELVRKMHKALHYFDPKHPLPAAVDAEFKAEGDLVSELLARSDDNNMKTRREAMGQLADHDDPRVVDFLIAQVDKEVDQAKRLESIDAMGRKEGAKFLPCLHDLLRREKSFQVRTNVADALRKIGMVESVVPLLEVLKNEKKSQVRSLLLRALMTCGGPRDDVQKEIERLLVRGDELDQITIMCELTETAWHDRYEKGLLKCLKANDSQVRAAAFWLAGCHRIEVARKPMKMRLSGEKGASRNACAWALECLGETMAEPGEDPSSAIKSVLPSASF